MSSKQNDLNNGKKIINVFLEMDYNIYKSKIKKYIFEHIQKIFEIFNEELNDNLTKLYILHKKDLLENDYLKYTEILIEFCKYINSLDYIDQQEYFIILIKMLNIFVLIKKINKEENKANGTNINENNTNNIVNLSNVRMVGDKYIKLIDLKLINKRILECISLISNENIIVEIFLLFITNKNDNSKKNIIFVSEKLAIDFFMYWSAYDIYKFIMTNINSNKNKLIHSMKKYRNEFINSYEHKMNILKNLYFDQINTKLILKYKITKNNIAFDELIKDIGTIDIKLNDK